MATFAERLNEALVIRNTTAAELSRLIGVNEGIISCHKSGKYEAKQRRLEEIAIALNVSEAWLMGCDVPMEREKPQPPQTEDPMLRLRFALWGDAAEEIPDEKLEEVRNFANYIKEQYQKE